MFVTEASVTRLYRDSAINSDLSHHGVLISEGQMINGIFLILRKRYPIHTALSEQVIPLVKFSLI